MKKIKSIFQHIAPTLASSLGGPFSDVAKKFINDNLIKESASDGRKLDVIINELISDSKNLPMIKNMDDQFAMQMKELNVDIFSLENDAVNNLKEQFKGKISPQVVISVLFLIGYFLMLGAIFFVEVSDSFNMEVGENSLMGELQILFGVLTAGIGQVLSYWFGGILK